MPDWNEESKYQGLIAGVDEAGRGPWAGPVVAATVVFYTRNINPTLINSLNDSKKLSAKKREELYELLKQEAQNGKLNYGIGEASAQEIDDMNILQATFLAMRRAVEKLPKLPDMAIIDGNRQPKNFPCPSVTLIKGDATSYSVAAASIMAKVYRDRLMTELARKYPFYGFEKNAGYGTKAHIEGLKKHGITPEHRKTYRPIAEIIQSQCE